MIRVSGPVVWEKDVDTGLRKLLEPCWVELPFEAPIVPRGYVPFMHVERVGKRLRMCFEPSFIWDGASGPTIDPSDWTWPPLGHDGCFRLIRRGLWPESLNAVANALFYRMLAERPVPKPVFETGGPWYRRLGRTLFVKPAAWSWWGIRSAVRPLRALVWYQAVDKASGDADDLHKPQRNVGT